MRSAKNGVYRILWLGLPNVDLKFEGRCKLCQLSDNEGLLCSEGNNIKKARDFIFENLNVH